MVRFTRSVGAKAIEPLIVVVASITVLLALATGMSAPGYDEFYHLLAAESWKANGTLAIGEGTYTRAWLFTKVLGALFLLGGDSIESARILPIIGAVGWTVAVFCWTRAFIGRWEAWLASGLLLFSATYLHVATNIRFYSWHGFAVFISFMAVCYLASDKTGSTGRWAWALVLAAALVVALHLQITTAIAVAAIIGWLVILHCRAIWQVMLRVMHSWARMTVSALLIALSVLVGLYSGLASDLWQQYQATAPWNAGKGVLFYHQLLQRDYPVFWALYPAIALASIIRFPRYGLAMVVIFVVALAVHSFAGLKAPRYLCWAFPFLFVSASICGVGLAQYFRSRLGAIAALIDPRLNGHPRMLFFLWLGFIGILLLFVSVNNRGTWRAFEMMASNYEWRSNVEWTTDWTTVLPRLRELAANSEVVITTHSLAGLYYLGRSDYVLNHNVMMHTGSREEFGVDPRTGIAAISTAESLSRIIDCHGSGLVLVDPIVFGDPVRGTSREVNRVLRKRTERVMQVDASVVRAYIWEREPENEIRPQCPKSTAAVDRDGV